MKTQMNGSITAQVIETPELIEGGLCGNSYSGKTYEAHITIEPVEDYRLEQFKTVAHLYQFKVADLIMVKNRKITSERSNKDSFCTGWSDDFDELSNRTLKLIACLNSYKFKVWRYKIEQTLLDVRYDKEKTVVN